MWVPCTLSARNQVRKENINGRDKQTSIPRQPKWFISANVTKF